ncbi:MAG: TIGR00269 family protein, partial [Sulfolobales archaeon]|nr:TIGR00269 family protein [Sulfolobales archaeon]
TVVEGVEGYNRVDDVAWIVEASRNYGIDLHLTSFKEFTGYSLDEIVSLDRLRKLETSPCTYCGVLRRRIINYHARTLGYDKVVTAHNLDDEVQTYLMNLLRGDEGRLIQNHPLSSTLSRYFIKRVKPLRKIYEWETSAYAFMRGFKFQEAECPYIRFRPTLRAVLRDYLYEVERSKPGSLLRVLEAIDSYIEKELLKKASNLVELPQCSVCGSPTAYGRSVCVLCDLLSKIGVNSRLPF